MRSLPLVVAEKLREAILAGAFKPGDRLVEQRLAARFRIGQPTLREALKELELQGFVRKKAPNKGTYVTHLSQDDFRKIQEVRITLEARAIERAAARWNPDVQAQMARIVEDMDAAARVLDLATFHKDDLLFHRTIWDLTGNEYLSVALQRVAFGLFAFVLLQRADDSRNEFVAAAEQHKRILAGLRSGDPQVARDAFIRATADFWGEYHQVDIEQHDGVVCRARV